MPYQVVKRSGKFVVEKQDGSKTFGTHDTKEEADRQLAALYAAEKRSAEARELHLLGAVGHARTEMVGAKEYLVVPVVALMEGVIHAVNAETPEFVPFDTLQKAAESWNGKPVTLGHPRKDGKQCSAQDDAVLAAHGIGTIRNARVEGKKMLCEALIESSRAKQMHPDMYARLAGGGTEEVSVGAMVLTDKKPGVWKNGKRFMASWIEAIGDHLAFLPGGRGACSVAMGCGTHRAAMRVCEDGLEFESLSNPEGINQYTKGGRQKSDHATSDHAGDGAVGPKVAIGTRVRIHAPDDLHIHGRTAVVTARTGTTVSVRRDDMRGARPMLDQRHISLHHSFLRYAEEKPGHPLGDGAEMQSIIDPETLRCLRDIPQSERDKMSASDFAGPDQSFPIKTQADVDAAKSLIGKAADPEAVKRKIIAIAKRKGLAIPDAWKTMKAAQSGGDAEEAAELVAYQSMQTILAGCGDQLQQVNDLVAALIEDETESPTETAAEEEAEEEIETARIETVRTICQAMIGALSSVVSVTYSSALQEDSNNPRYMAALAGASISAKNMGLIQAVHDHSMALGATCDRSNYKLMEANIKEGDDKLKESKLNDPTRFYIESVQKQKAK